MADLTWSPSAQDDLDDIARQLSRTSEQAAGAVVSRIIAMVETIPEFPFAGKAVQEYEREDLRERVVGNYRVIYRVAPDCIEIRTVVHGARDLRRLGRDL